MPSMVHPYYGTLIRCAEFDGSQHDPTHPGRLEMCDYCGRPLITCMACKCITSCCACAERHAYECPWPL